MIMMDNIGRFDNIALCYGRRLDDRRLDDRRLDHFASISGTPSESISRPTSIQDRQQTYCNCVENIDYFIF